MKKQISIIFFLVLALASFSAFATEELLDRVVAVINDDVITQAELDSVLRPIYDDYAREYSGETLMKEVNAARQKILSQMIEDKLVYQEAVRQGLTIKDEEVEKEFRDFLSRLEFPEQLDTMLAQEGLTRSALKERLKKQAIVRQLQDREIRAKVVISPAEVEAFYNNNPEKFKIKERIKVRSVTVKKSEEAREKGIADEKAKQKIELLEQKIRLYNKFDEVAKESSEDARAQNGGLGDWVSHGSMIESMDNVIFNTPIGKTTAIVESPIGYHIFRVEEKEAERTRSFDDARDQVLNYLYQKESDERFKAWVENLKKSAYISIK